MELHLLNPANLRRSCFTVKSRSNKSPDSDINHHPEGLQFRHFSKKDLSRILRTESAIKAIERKANSSKYNNLLPKAVLEALNDAIKQNRWESALKVSSSSSSCNPCSNGFHFLCVYMCACV